jgi:ketosteroid isomerase-like protein
MSAANIELIKAAVPSEVDLVEVFAGDDAAAAFIGDLSAVDPDLEVEFAGTVSGAPGLSYRGIDGLLEGWRDWLMPWQSYRLEAEDFVDAGDQVLMLVRVRATTNRDGVELEHRSAAVWTVENGMLVAVRFFLERSEAFDFVGLTPP